MYHAFYERETGDETIQQIAADVNVSHMGLRNHMLKHTKMRSVAVEEIKTAKTIEKVKAKVQKDLELSFDHDDVVPETDYEQALRVIIANGLDELKKGNLKVTTTQLLAAAKIKADYMSKKRGQDTELIKTMYRAAGGSKKKEVVDGERVRASGEAAADGVAEELGTLDTGGAERPGDLYHEVARYAASQWAD